MMILRSDSALAVRAASASSPPACSAFPTDIKVETADTNDANDSLRAQNPLGKIPTLVLEDGSTLFNSRVIVEYLDHRAGGGKIIPQEPKARFAALRLQALADGMTDAQILLLYEGRFRPPEHHVKKWTDYQADKIKRGLDGAGGRSAVARSDSRTSARSRSPASSATAIFASPATGARRIPSSSPGSTASPRRCRPSPRPRWRRSAFLSVI